MELNLLFPEKTQLFTEDIKNGFTTKKSLMKYALIPLGKSNGQKYEDSQTGTKKTPRASHNLQCFIVDPIFETGKILCIKLSHEV